MTLLRDRIAVVTGASRGVGRGTALALGAAGATVYVTGRTARGHASPTGLPGSVDETADGVTALGGRGVAVRCDHHDDGQARDLFARIETDAGRIDVLVNNAWSGYERLHDGQYQLHLAAFWAQPLSMWDEMIAGVRAQYVATALAAPLLLRSDRGLVVNVSSLAGRSADPNVAYGVAKAATEALTSNAAARLREHGVAVVSLVPGLVRTEGILRWAEHLDLTDSQSPELVGRAVVALAADAAVLDRTGQSLLVADLAAQYELSEAQFALEARA